MSSSEMRLPSEAFDASIARVKIRVCARSHSENSALGELLQLHADLFPVEFIIKNSPNETAAGEICFASSESNAAEEVRIPTLRVASGQTVSVAGRLVENHVHFADDSEVPFPFRGRSLRVKTYSDIKPLSLTAPAKILAATDTGPVWVVRQEFGLRHWASAFPLPKIRSEDALFDVFNGERFVELLPLHHWMRELNQVKRYDPPPLRACFIFDDPNLHWPTYGRVDYREIIAHAERENYHASFATIPLDAWFTHQLTAEIFRANTRRLSLVVHGNNHVKRELARDYTLRERFSLLRQALGRIERLERTSGVRVNRVMVPPHGACSEEMLATLPECGFESACISHGSLRAHNRSKAWTRKLGVLPSEQIRDCPVLPRWAMTGNVNNTILLAAYLHQPLILRGHHEDLKDGVEVLDKLAGLINGLGTVVWANMSDLSRMNYWQRIDEDAMRLRPLGRKVVCSLPQHVTRLIIEDPTNRNWDRWELQSENGQRITIQAGEVVPLPTGQQGNISIELKKTTSSTNDETASNGFAPIAFVRRLLTEGRDRLLVR